MKKLIILPLLSLLLLTGCAAAENPAAVVTGKPDMARDAGLTSALQNVVSELESTRNANGDITLSNPVVSGYETKVMPQGMGANYCAAVTDSKTGKAKTYTSVDKKTVEGDNCN